MAKATKRRPVFARFTEQEERAVRAIVSRAVEMYGSAGIRLSPLDLRMDLAAVHAQCPLRLAELAAADPFNFAHDISGIRFHLDRTTGELSNHFWPRFARPTT